MFRGCAALLAAVLALAGCGTATEPPPPRDVLLITLDTARADRFSYAGSSVRTPRIDALAGEGAAFLHAISPAPVTLPAHASLMTGRIPPAHTVRDNGTFHLPDSERTLAEVLAAAGYVTGAFVGSQVLDRRYGLDQGFATYDDAIPDPGSSVFRFYGERRGDEVGAAVVRWLAAQKDGRPLFAWVHLFDPHAPYRPPEPERSRYASGYDGEIAFVDRVVGQLVDHWRARRDLARTLVIVTADHGEGLGEHGEPTHGVLVHEATLRVPLVVRAPGLRVDAPIREPVSLVDLLPTVLGLLGLPSPPGVQGRDLGPLLRGEELAWKRESGYAESLYAQLHHACAPLLSLREGRFKLVRGLRDELYDLEADAGEAHDLAGREVRASATLGEGLTDLLRGQASAQATRLPLDEETRQVLASLGYLGSGLSRPGAVAPRDPREALQSLRQMAEADRRAVRGDGEGAIDGYRAVLAAEPWSVDARFRLAQLLRSQGDGAGAVTVLTEALALSPEEPFLYETLGETLHGLGRHRESLKAYEAGQARHPGVRGLRNGRWRALHQVGRREQLLAEAERAVEADPRDGAARYARALACCGHGTAAEYAEALERELGELPGDPVLTRALAGARAER